MRVRGSNIMQPPLLETDDAKLVELRDSFGDLMALLVNLEADMWILVTRDDDDWGAMLVRYGYGQLGQSVDQAIRSSVPIIKPTG